MSDHEHLQHIVYAHPDGLPHRKACPECAFRRANPQRLSDEDFDWMAQQRAMGGFVFYCTHREDRDGWSRECACWAAMTGTAAPTEGGDRG